KQQLSANDQVGAAKTAQEALAVDSNNVSAKQILAQSAGKSGISTGSGAQSADSHVAQGDAAMRENKRELAKQEYQRALEINPNSASALRQMGILRLQQSDIVGANTDLSRALVLNPNDKIAAKNLTELWQRQVSRNPKEVTGHLGLARAYQQGGDLKSAQSEYRTVVSMDPQNPNLPAARQSFKLALARQEAQRSIAAAHTLEGQGLIPDAHQKAVEAVGLCPGDVSMRLYQGRLSEKIGRYNEAHDAYMNVLREDPTNEEAAKALAGLPPLAAPQMVTGQAAPPLAPPVAGFAGMPALAAETPSYAPAPPAAAASALAAAGAALAAASPASGGPAAPAFAAPPAVPAPGSAPP
ncbi:MAG: tetratricopeptide repeat protein, partial [Terriglobales bacterium]